MKYSYYPGCTLETSATSYEDSTKTCSMLLGIEFEEIPDWNCCGATANNSVDHIVANTLVARNIALAEPMKNDIVAPCSACFKNLHETNRYLKEDATIRDKINLALAEDDLKVNGILRIRHLLDVFVNDVGIEAIKAKVKKPLKDLKVATYYGCQIVRPENDFDSMENPTKFEELISALGATNVNFPLRLKCCGASLIITNNKVALELVKNILKCAVENGADCLVTACPLCQLNLDAYQKNVNREFGTNFQLPILYFTQLMGVAFEQPLDKLGIGKEFVGAASLLSRYA